MGISRQQIEQLISECGSDTKLAAKVGVDVRSVRRWVVPVKDKNGKDKYAEPQGSAARQLEQLVEEKLQVPNRNGPHSDERGLVGVRKGEMLRFGVCPEFSDTLLPVLCHELFEADKDLPPIEFVPIEWDDRCLSSLYNEMLDIVIYNSYCADEFESTKLNYRFFRNSVCSFSETDDLDSGDFYIAFSVARNFPANLGEGPEVSDARAVKELVDLVGIDSTVAIVPPADMRHVVTKVRELVSPKSVKDKEPRNWFVVPPGVGLNILLSPPACLADANLSYVGGQDQLASIIVNFKAREQANSGRQIRFVRKQSIEKQYDVSFPPDLSRNQLLARRAKETESYPQFMERIAELMTQRQKELENENQLLGSKDLLKWQMAYSTRFRQDDVESDSSFAALQEEFRVACRQSSLLRKWFNKLVV